LNFLAETRCKELVWVLAKKRKLFRLLHVKWPDFIDLKKHDVEDTLDLGLFGLLVLLELRLEIVDVVLDRLNDRARVKLQ
jgi:hypothetical protein